MATMTGGQALAHQLVLEGVTDVFGIPGVQLDWAVDGLRQVADRIRFTVPRHEQTTSYMADGYARASGRFGTCMVVPGPGMLNAMAGLSTAYACNSPVLCIAGNIYGSAVGRNLGLLHEIKDQTGVLASVTKWQGSASTPADVPNLVREAVRQLRTGRPAPVGIEIAHDVLSASGEVELITPDAEDLRQKPDAAAVERAAALLGGARFPVIFVGGGALAGEAPEALRALAERLQAPVVIGENGRGALSDRHPLALNALGGRAVFPHADVVLVVGSRFVDTAVGNPAWPSDAVRYVYLNIDPSAWAPPRRAEVAIEADAALGMRALEAAVSRRPARGDELDRVRAWAAAQSDAIRPQRDFVRAIRNVLPDDGILVNELTQVGYYARFAYPVYRPGTFIGPGYQGTLGYGFPTSLGVAAGAGGRPVVGITGDGGFGWGMQELATARKYDLRVATIVFNDGHFGNVHRMQEDQFGTAFGTGLKNPDFGKLADAFEVPYSRADDGEALERALREALDTAGPTLIEARVGGMPSPWHLMRLRNPPFVKAQPAPPNPLGEPPSASATGA
ncbi:thiamine pyrophosphate-dependent enzyme [Roseomonas populi]|uniref:Thiamine pyrophosphate-binding protein n=1 Tax=Roseomonas populi TaxID=3121582 RepID=A0ABT1WZB9_9PROT|nr:thiamine pyrophosphate-dependent enzyme [Roseomonas pecuniae]MCR0981192.1 thiamine pyrophosphate-binding protein [Roseomonas pecuniae]